MKELLKYEDFLDYIKKILNQNLGVFVYEIRNFDESQLIAKYIASLSKYSDVDNFKKVYEHENQTNNQINAVKDNKNKDNKIMEIAINELLINSIEHGMLEVNYSLKSELLKNNQWIEHVEDKLNKLPNDKCVKMLFKKANFSPNTISVEVLDGGRGFNSNLLEEKKRKAPSIERHGRGGMLIELGLPNLKYNELGNGATFYITCNM